MIVPIDPPCVQKSNDLGPAPSAIRVARVPGRIPLIKWPMWNSPVMTWNADVTHRSRSLVGLLTGR
jgi:hypothetical protein